MNGYMSEVVRDTAIVSLLPTNRKWHTLSNEMEIIDRG